MTTEFDFSRFQIFVATPQYGGLSYDGYNRSMEQLVRLASQHKLVVHRWVSRNESLITRARNTAVVDFLRSTATHLMFIDADIAFPPEVPLQMLSTEYPVVAVSYPKKSINWDNIRAAVERGEKNLWEFQADHVINVRERDLRIERQCVEVLDAGTGFMMIERSVILQMIYAHPEWLYLSDSMGTRGQPAFSIFDCGIYDKEITEGVGRYLSEDYRFCREYQKLGGKIMLLLDDRLEHTGTYTFRGKLPLRPKDQVPQ